MRLTTLIAFVASLLPISASTFAETTVIRLTVDGGDVARTNAPVAATLASAVDQPEAGAAWTLVPSGKSGLAVPAQVQRVGSNVVVRWIEPDLQSGRPKTYDLVASDARVPGGFRFVDGDGWRDLAFNDNGVYRHMNRYDPANHDGTFKPFHHVYGTHDEGFITNGPGSEEWGASGEGIRFPHHRGLFFGFNKTPFGDFWHGKAGESQRHREYKKDREFVSPVVAREASVNEWVAKGGTPVIRDTREVTAWRVSDRQVVLDFDVTLESLTGEAIPLGGDPQHAGFHFRAANEVAQAPAAQSATSPTTRRGTSGGNAIYTRPASAVSKPNDVWENCPWVYCAFTIKGHPYGVTEMDHPTNPQPTVFSTRAYGRFGAFFDGQQVTPDKPLKLRYRFVVRDATDTPDAKQLEEEYQDWITPVKVTVAR